MLKKEISGSGPDASVPDEDEMHEQKGLLATFGRAVRAQFAARFAPRETPLSEEEKQQIQTMFERRTSEGDITAIPRGKWEETYVKPIFEARRKILEGKRDTPDEGAK